jgi:hypothetical protein
MQTDFPGRQGPVISLRLPSGWHHIPTYRKSKFAEDSGCSLGCHGVSCLGWSSARESSPDWNTPGAAGPRAVSQSAGPARYSIAPKWLSFGLPARAGGTLPRLSASARELRELSTRTCKNPRREKRRAAVQSKGLRPHHGACRNHLFFARRWRRSRFRENAAGRVGL